MDESKSSVQGKVQAGSSTEQKAATAPDPSYSDASLWLRHSNKGRAAFYRRRGDDSSCTLIAPGGGVSVTEKPEIKLHALCQAESWFEERWMRLVPDGSSTE